MQKKVNDYDYLLVGAGLFNAIFAKEASKDNKRCLVIEKRPHIGGNLYCENIESINIHSYGPHIFHTSDTSVWNYINSICEFNHFVYTPIANYKGEIYNLPFNMNTFYQMWKTKTPCEALSRIESQRIPIANPQNLEEQALSLVGRDIFQKLIKGYTEKQWGKDSKELPAFIIRRLPLRFTYNNNYFNDPYQGIPIGGYNSIFKECFREADILTNTDFLTNPTLRDKAPIAIYTGMIDRFFNYCYGQLEYRSLHFESEVLDTSNFQGCAVVNYTDEDIPYTRIIESKHFEFGCQCNTVITKEYPISWQKDCDPFYPINTEENNKLYEKYKEKAEHYDKNLYFAGRLGSYKYYNMDEVIRGSIQLYSHIKSLNT